MLDKVKNIIKKHSRENKYTKNKWLEVPKDDLETLNTSILALEEKYQELEKERNSYMTYFIDAKRWFDKHDPNGYVSPAQDKCESTLEAHNLEQQAKGLECFAEKSKGYDWEDSELQMYLSSASRDLRLDAAKLKG